MKKHLLLLGNVLYANMLLTVAAFAQTGGPTPDPSAVADVPIDGGVSFLAAAGIAYGAKKLYDHRKNQDKSE